MWFAFAFFILSLAGIVGLLVLKGWEMRRGRIIAPALRDRLDAWALRLRDLVIALQADLEKLPPETVHIARLALHELALGAAAVLRFLSLQAHTFADFVSHKHRFERRAPRSEFLKKVTEHKNSNGDSRLDTTA